MAGTTIANISVTMQKQNLHFIRLYLKRIQQMAALSYNLYIILTPTDDKPTLKRIII